MPTHSDDRHELAAGLRALRLDAGRSTTELARQLGWSQSKVSRVERGVTLAKPAEVDAWARMLRSEADRRRHLVGLSERQSIELTEWKRTMAPGRRRVQEEIRSLEADSTVLWEFAMDVVPGLAQTARYAEAMVLLGRVGAGSGHITDSEVATAVQARLARQAVLDDPAKRFKLLLTETALRRSLLPAADMRAQLRRLIEVAGLPTVELGIIPFSGRERTHTYHGFCILGDPDVDDAALVLVETVTRALTIRAVDELREYIAHYRRLTEGALFGAELVALVQEISARV